MTKGRDIKGITIEIDGDTTKLNKALKDSESQIRNSVNQLKDIDKLLKLDPGNTELLTQKYKNLQTEISGAKDKLKILKEAQEQMVREGKVGTEEYDALQREIVETEQKIKSLTKEMKEFGSVSAQQVAAAGEKMKEVGNKISGVGDTMTRTVTTPIVGMATAAVKTAADFDSAMSKVAAISGATGSDFEALRNKALEMGEKTKFSASEAAEAMNYMAMAGWKTQDMLDGVAGVMNLAAASGEELGTTSDIVTDALTAFGMSASESGHFADILAATAANANTNVAMMGQSFKYVAPVAGAMGYKAEDVAVALGLMANSGIKADMAGTSLRNMFTRMAKPTDEAAMAMDRLGIKLSDDYGHMYSFQEIMGQVRKGMSEVNMPLEEYNKRLDELDAALEDGTIKQKTYDKELEELNLQAFGAEGAEKARAAAMLGGTRAMAGMLAITEASEEDYQNLTDAIYHSSDAMVKTADGSIIPLTQAMAEGKEIIEQYSGAAEAQAARMQDNAEGQWTIFLSKVQTLAITIGDMLMPAVMNIITELQEWADKFNALDDDTKEMIVKIALMVAALGPLLSIGGRLITGIGTIMTWAPHIVGALGSVATFITGTLAPAISGLISGGIVPLIATAGPIIAAIGLVIAAGVLWVKNWDEIKEAGQVLVERTIEHFENLKAKMGEIYDNIIEAGNTLKERTAEHFENLKTSIGATLDNISLAAQTFGERTTEHFENFKTNVSLIFDNVKEAANTLKERTGEHFEGLKQKASALGDSMREKFENIKQIFNDTVNNIKTIIDGWKQKFEDLKNGISTAIENMKQKIDSFKQKFDDIKSHIMGVVDYLKGCFNFDWKLPEIKLPHFNVSGSFSLDPPSTPHFSVDWYAKAMEKGMILNSPTIFGMSGGRLLGGGEAGPEAVVGTQSLQNMITNAVVAAGLGGDTVIPVYIGSERIETIVVTAAQKNNYRSGGR